MKKITLNNKNFNYLINILEVQYNRGGIVAAEAEEILKALFNDNTDEVNEVLEFGSIKAEAQKKHQK